MSAIKRDGSDHYAYREAVADVPDLAALAGRSRASDTLLGDVHAALYKIRPVVEEAADVAHRDVLADLMETSEYRRLRATTRMDEVASAFGTVELGRALAEALPEDDGDDQDDDQDDDGEPGDGEPGDGKPQYMLNGCSDQDEQRRALRKIVGNAAKATEEATEAVKALCGSGSSRGGPSGRGDDLDLAAAVKAADALRDNRKLQEIARLAGRIRRVGAGKRETRYQRGPDDVVDVEYGRDLASVIASELIALTTPELETEALLRLTQGRLLQIKREGKAPADMGPLVVLVDESASMGGEREHWAKATTLALLDLARKSKRDFCVVSFNDYPTVSHWGRNPSQLDVLTWLARDVRGGTDFDRALDAGLTLIEESGRGGRWDQADLIMITDGDDQLTGYGYPERLASACASLYTIYIQTQAASLDAISDGVARLSSVENDDAALTLAFGI